MNEVRRCIDLAVGTKKRSLPEFMKVLQRNGVGCYAQLRRGEVIGISFTLDNEKFRGSKLGIGYSWKSLTDRGIKYDKSDHREEVERLNGNEKCITNMLKPFDKKVTISTEKNLAAYFIDNRKSHNHQSKNIPSVYAFWLRVPLNKAGKTKQQIESDINQLKLLRIVLAIYFSWLRERKKQKLFLGRCLNPYVSRVVENGKLYSVIIDKYNKQITNNSFTLIPVNNSCNLEDTEPNKLKVFRPKRKLTNTDEFTF
ncbi:MAG: hypothetical protein GY775_06320 [Candidatus Scalindua sp.]|nr:hypothetical protein [Candidatus Scalindua sp.]